MTMHAPSVQELEQLWADLAGTVHGRSGWQARRVIAGSRHDCFIAVTFPDRQRLLSVAAEEDLLRGAESRPLTSGVLLVRGTEPLSGRPTVDIVLRDAAHSDIFTALVADLLSVLADSDESAASGELLLARLEDWRRLLAAVTPQGLTPERQRGLFGELTVLADMLLAAAGPRAVLAWTGPDRELQDFQFANAAIEVKTVSGNSAQVVRIANERQLDYRVTGQLFLLTLALDARHAGPGMSLPDLAAALRQRMRSIGMSSEFEQRLTRAGYLETQAHLYADCRYAVREVLVHLVDEQFPHITERDLPDGVSDVSYQVDLHAATAFRTTGQEMIRTLDLST